MIGDKRGAEYALRSFRIFFRGRNRGGEEDVVRLAFARLVDTTRHVQRTQSIPAIFATRSVRTYYTMLEMLESGGTSKGRMDMAHQTAHPTPSTTHPQPATSSPNATLSVSAKY